MENKMNSNKVLVFDVKGNFGFFKTPEGTRTPISFPFTRTSLIGLIGAILGEERNSYWINNHPLAEADIAIQIMKEIHHTNLKVNYIQTKGLVSASRGNIKPYTSKLKRGFVTAVNLDLLRDVHYRIYFKSDDSDLYNRLKEYLQKSWCHYPPYLGHANLLADVIYKGEYSLKTMKGEQIKISSIIGISQIDKEIQGLLQSRITIVMGIPIKANVIKSKGNLKLISTEKDDFILLNPSDQPLTIKLNEETLAYQIDNDEKTQIVFLPTTNINNENN